MKRINYILPVVIIAFILSCTDKQDIIYSGIEGLWKCEELDEQSNVSNFNVDIENVKNYDNIFIISNFHNTGEDTYIRASVNDSIITISKQAYEFIQVEGIGKISSDFKLIELNYIITDESRTMSYQAVFYR
jgi:hypothetical protein